MGFYPKPQFIFFAAPKKTEPKERRCLVKLSIVVNALICLDMAAPYCDKIAEGDCPVGAGLTWGLGGEC